MVKAGIKNVCIHKGLFAPGVEKQYPNLRGFADVADVGQAAKDWPQLKFYHLSLGLSPCRRRSEAGAGRVRTHGADFMDQRPCRHSRQYGVNNVYGDVGQLFADHAGSRAERLRRVDGRPDQGLGADHVCWGTDALWTGAPQWQIEGLRRLEIPEAMQKKFGYARSAPPMARSNPQSSAATMRGSTISSRSARCLNSRATALR